MRRPRINTDLFRVISVVGRFETARYSCFWLNGDEQFGKH